MFIRIRWKCVFANQNAVYQKIASNIAQFLANQEMIPEAAPGKDKALETGSRT